MIYKKRFVTLLLVTALIVSGTVGCKGEALEGSVAESAAPAAEYSADIESPAFSQKSGFYSDPFKLEITAPDGMSVYYTTDGSMPDLSSEKYSAPIDIADRSGDDNVLAEHDEAAYPETGMAFKPKNKITKSTVIRAAAADKNGKLSKVTTATYFVGIDLDDKYKGLPVISVSVDQDDLFNYDSGIYTTGKIWDEFSSDRANNRVIRENQYWLYESNFSQHGREWEKPVHVDFFEGDGSLGFSEDMGMRITGKASRASLQKSLKFYARSDYGVSVLEYPLIPDALTSSGEVNSRYDTFIIRNGANDNQNTKLRDPALQDMVSDRDFETQQGRPCIAFVDGEYWGVYHITEDYSASHIKELYGYPKKEVVIIKNGALEDGEDADLMDYKAMLEFVRSSDMSDPVNYEQLCKLVDVQSMADYFASQMYINNEDLFNDDDVNNYRLWKTRSRIDDGKGDGRWRWMMYDVDFSSNVYGGPNGGSDKAIKASVNDKIDTVVFSKTLRENSEFRELFLNSAMDIANSDFTRDHVKATIDKFDKMYRSVLEEHFQRFGPDFRSNGFSYWYPQALTDLRSFFNARRKVFISALQKYFDAGDTASFTVFSSDTSKGCVRVNTIVPVLTDEGWEGEYFSGCLVTLEAVPAEGCSFTGWSGDVWDSSPIITVEPDQLSSVTAVFE